MENKLENQLKSKFSNEEADAALIKIDSSNEKLTEVQTEIFDVKENIAKEINYKLNSVTNKVKQVNMAVDNAKEPAAEEMDKENRRCNIIMYRAVQMKVQQTLPPNETFMISALFVSC